MKKIFLLMAFSISTLYAQTSSEKPTLEQLINSKEAEISIKCFRDDEKVNLEAWQEIAVAVNNLINLCYATDTDESLKDQIIGELHKTIDCMRDTTKVNADNGINGALIVAVGTPPTVKPTPTETIE